MKRIAILICLAMIGSLLHAAVGSVASLAAPPHHTAHGAAITTSAEAFPVAVDAGVSHLHHARADLHEGLSAEGVQVSCALADDHGSTQCRSAGNDCCQVAMVLPAQCDVASPEPIGIAATVVINPPQGRIQQGIYKPPKS